MTRTLFIAIIAAMTLTGAAYGASAITGAQIKDGTITGRDVKNRSLTPADFRGSIQGPQGPPGSVGPAGPAGPSALSAIKSFYGQMTVAAGAINGGSVSCPAGQRMISGGYAISGPGIVFLNEATEDQTGWAVALDNSGSSAPVTLEGNVNCAGAGQAAAARMSHSRRMVRVRQGHAAQLIASRAAAHR